ncbi:6172_t:CDS:2 [Dentiscutata erythropus]|uniref:6172_t:CDS:1 n=1 Tax=Dentiscutata erythropus TaxID=1348616 RepID=A0A9N8WQU1_9GLOM|nr:6172_t:CDS:2 [Dentiscutata erythropus]
MPFSWHTGYQQADHRCIGNVQKTGALDHAAMQQSILTFLHFYISAKKDMKCKSIIYEFIKQVLVNRGQLQPRHIDITITKIISNFYV